MRNKELSFARYDIAVTNQLKVNANDNNRVAANDNFAVEAIAIAA